MDNEQGSSETEAAANKLLRPVLIASKLTVIRYSAFLNHLLAGLADESIPSVLVCPPDCNVDSLVPPSVEVIRHPVFNVPLMENRSRKVLIERLEKFKPTVLHCLCESQASLSRHLGRQLDVPYLLMVNSLQSRFGRLAVSLRGCARIIVPAGSIAANLAKFHPKFSRRIEHINMGTFVEASIGCFYDSNQLVSMVAACPLDNESEFENLFGAVRHLAIDGYEFILVIMAGGRAKRRLRKLLASLGLSKIVVSVPQSAPWHQVVASGDIFIRPAAGATFDPLLLEAMSVGAVVAGCKGGVDDLIIEDKTAVVFDPYDRLSIKGCLQQILDRRQWARQIAAGAQEYLRKKHSVSKMVADILRVYREVQMPA